MKNRHSILPMLRTCIRSFISPGKTQAGFGLIGGVTAMVVIIGIASATMLESMSRATKASNAVNNRGATMTVLQQAANTLSREANITANGVARPIAAEPGEGPSAGGGRLPSSIGGFLDGYGKQLGLCSFYNGSEGPGVVTGQILLNPSIPFRENMPNAPAFVVVSAGKNGNFELKCDQIYSIVSGGTGSYNALKPLTEIQGLSGDDMFVASDITDTANRKSQNMVNLLSSGSTCDPITQKLVYVNAGGSAEFRCVDESDPTVSAHSIGTAGGMDILKNDITTTDNYKNIQIRKLEAGNNINLSLNGDSIRIESSGSGTIGNIGTGAPVYAGIFGGTHAMRTLIGQGGTTVNAIGDHVIIQSAPASGGTITGGQNVGTGTADVYRGNSGSLMQFARVRSGDTSKLVVSNDATGAVVLNPILAGAEGVNGVNVTVAQPPGALPDNVSGAVASPTNPEKANIFVGKETPTSTQLRFRQLKEGLGIEFNVDADGSLVISYAGGGAGEVDPFFTAARPSGACTAAQKLTWNGSAFVCSTDLTGAGLTVAHSGSGIQLAPESGAVSNLTLKRINAAAGSALSVTESSGTISVGSPNMFLSGSSIGIGAAPDTNYRMNVVGANGLSVSGTGARVSVWGAGGATVHLGNDGSVGASNYMVSGWRGAGNNGPITGMTWNFGVQNNGNVLSEGNARFGGRITGGQFAIQNPSVANHGMYAYPQPAVGGVEHIESTQMAQYNDNAMNADNLFYFMNVSNTKHARIGVEKIYAYDGIATKYKGIDLNAFTAGTDTYLRGFRLYATGGTGDSNGDFRIEVKAPRYGAFDKRNTIAIKTSDGNYGDIRVGNLAVQGSLSVAGGVSGPAFNGAETASTGYFELNAGGGTVATRNLALDGTVKFIHVNGSCRAYMNDSTNFYIFVKVNFNNGYTRDIYVCNLLKISDISNGHLQVANSNMVPVPAGASVATITISRSSTASGNFVSGEAWALR